MYKNIIYKLIIAAVVIFVVDLLWLSTGGQYAVRIAENIQGSKVSLNYYYALVVYFFLAYMLLKTNSYMEAFFFGVCIYGVYDFTTLAIFKNYDVRFAVADTIWGGILFVLSRYFLSFVVSVRQNI
jgi:uncharacterized membrane protein